MNPILQMMGGMGGGANGRNILLQAFAAMTRGETPEAFLKSLAKNNPQLQGLDLDNLEKTAHALSAQKGVDESQVLDKVKAEIGKGA